MTILQCTANISRISRSINYNRNNIQQQMFQDNATKNSIDLLFVSVSLSCPSSPYLSLALVFSSVSFYSHFSLSISRSHLPQDLLVYGAQKRRPNFCFNFLFEVSYRALLKLRLPFSSTIIAESISMN